MRTLDDYLNEAFASFPDQLANLTAIQQSGIYSAMRNYAADLLKEHGEKAEHLKQALETLTSLAPYGLAKQQGMQALDLYGSYFPQVAYVGMPIIEKKTQRTGVVQYIMNTVIVCKYDSPTRDSGDGVSSTTSSFTTKGGREIIHPNFQ